MVLESLLNPKKARENPKRIILIGFLSTIVSAILALWIFPSRSSFAMVFLTVMAVLPLIVTLIRQEELQDEKNLRKEKHILIREHKDIFLIYINLFLGMVLGFTFMFVLLPPNTVTDLFEDQVTTIASIRGSATSGTDLLVIIIINNLKVLFFCLLFSFIYGSGAIFILTWNASVISAAIGDLIRLSLQNVSELAYFHIIPLSFGRFLIHGIPEIGAYLLGGIAGGIISTAVIRNKVSKKYFSKIILDSADLIVLAVLLLFFAALVEVSISPLIGI